jgi:tetratricopeptide (TPR) repeat protein
MYALAEHHWPEGGTVRVRMGLHTGAGTLYDGHYIGLDVHEAARIAAAGHGGQILLSAPTRELVAHNLPSETTLRDLGTYRLKDLPRPERLYQLVLPGLPADFPRLKTLDLGPRDLPPRAPGFIGREQEQQALVVALRSSQAVAVVGLGGLGKSSLAAEAVHTLAANPATFPAGVAWVRCDSRVGVDGLIWIDDQLLAAWGASVPAEDLARAVSPEVALALRERALRERLRSDATADQRRSLVLFDNLERGLPMERLLEALQPLGITPLLTMRSEPSSPHVRLLRPEILPPEAAVQLFALRYADRGGSWSAGRDTVPARTIVDALGGLPLAIELAAARAARTHLPLPALAQELRGLDALALLRDPLEPSASVRYSLSKTLSALTPSQRARFAALGLPAGGDWALPIIERMLEGVSSVPPGAAAANEALGPAAAAPVDLDVLVAYSLVSLTGPSGEVDSAAPRVRLHPLVRDLAHEEWDQLPSSTQAEALAALLTGARDWLESQQFQGAELYRVLVPEEDLIAGALRLAVARQTELAQVTSIVEAWGPYLFMKSEFAVEMRMLQVESVRAIGDHPAELAALIGLVQACGFSGREDDAARHRRAALELARGLGDQAGLLRMLGALGEEAASHGRTVEAEQMYGEAEELAGQLGERSTDFDALNNLGNAARALGRLDDATRWCQRALTIARAAGVFQQEMLAEGNLAFLDYERGDMEAVRHFVEKHVPYARAIDNWYTTGVTVNVHGQLALQDGDFDTAAVDFIEALSEFEQGGVVPMAAHVRANQRLLAGLQALRQGDTEMAIQSFEQALSQFEEIGYLGDTPNQRPYVRQLLTQVRAQTAAPTAIPIGASSAAGEIATANAFPSRTTRRWRPWRHS